MVKTLLILVSLFVNIITITSFHCNNNRFRQVDKREYISTKSNIMKMSLQGKYEH